MASSAEALVVAPADRSQIWPPGTLRALFQIWTVNKLARSAWQHCRSLYGGTTMDDTAGQPMAKNSSVNGRRAWRKWAKAYRRWLNRDERRYRDSYEDEPLIHHRMTWFEAKKQFGPDLGHRNAKAFAARFLVGMTMGARKRAVRSAFVAYAEKWNQSRYLAMRSMYRIGQQLRPCPGCDKCEGRRPVNGMMIDIYRVICDGSGVLSARRRGGTSPKPRKLHIFGDLGKSGRPLGQ